MKRALLILVIASLCAPSQAAEKSLVFTKADRTPFQAMAILKANCLTCHNDEKKKGGLRLTTRENALKGGENGPALVPRQASESLVTKFILPDSDPHMPPKKQLSDKDIATLRQWIADGAKWDEKALTENPADTRPVRLVAMPASYQPVLALALSPDEKRLVAGRANRIYVHDLSQTNRLVVGQLEGHGDAVQSLAWSNDGKRLASGGFRRIVVWDMETLKQQRAITNNLVGRITALQFTSDDATLVAADGVPTKRGVVQFISVADAKCKLTLPAHKDSIYALRMSPDGKLLATGGADKLVRLWDIEVQKEVAILEAHMGHVLALTFKPDGSMLASGSADKVLNLWDVKTRKQEITINKHPAPVMALAWTQDGKSLYSACEDGSPRLFTDFKLHSGAESSDGARDRTFSGAGEMLYSLAVTSNGKTIFAGGHDGVVYIWNSEGKLQDKLAAPDLEVSQARKPTETALKQ